MKDKDQYYYVDGYQDALDMAISLVRNGYTVTISMGYKPGDYWKIKKLYRLKVDGEVRTQR